jgi:hypothetical protein
MGMFSIHGIDSNYAGEAIQRWWRNPLYRDLCRKLGIKTPEMLHEMINNGDLAGIPVVPDTDAKIFVEEDDNGVKIGGKVDLLTEGLIDKQPGNRNLYMDTSSGGNPDCVFRTEEEVGIITENYRGTFGEGANILFNFFPSIESLKRAAEANYKKAEKAGIIPTNANGIIIPRRQAESGLKAAQQICETTEEGLLRFNLPITILNNTILRPWKKGAAHVTPNSRLVTDRLHHYETTDDTILWGLSPILMYLWMSSLDPEEKFDLEGRLRGHGGGGGYRGVKGSLRIEGGIDQRIYTEMMNSILGIYPTETYGYTGQTHAIKLRWNPEREWIDIDKGERRIGAYEARIPEDVFGNAIVYTFNPLKGEVVEDGPGLVRALNFDGSSVQFDGAMQVNDRVYIDNGVIFGIRGLGSKYGC